MQEFIKAIGGRKYLMAIAVFVVCTIFVLLDKMSAGEFITGVVINSGIFAYANVEQKKITPIEESMEVQ